MPVTSRFPNGPAATSCGIAVESGPAIDGMARGAGAAAAGAAEGDVSAGGVAAGVLGGVESEVCPKSETAANAINKTARKQAHLLRNNNRLSVHPKSCFNVAPFRFLDPLGCCG